MNENYKFHCIYCGNKNNITRDHVVPRSWSQNYSFFQSNKNPLVPACRECNNTLSNVPRHTPEDRASYLIEKYEKKWAKILKLPFWEESEIKELGPNLQKRLKKSLHEKEVKQQRLRNLYRFKTTPFYQYN